MQTNKVYGETHLHLFNLGSIHREAVDGGRVLVLITGHEGRATSKGTRLPNAVLLLVLIRVTHAVGLALHLH